MPLSFSQLSSYRRCPKQYEYMAVKKVPRRISQGESFGSSIHNTLQRWGEREMAAMKTIDPKKQLTLFTDSHPAHDIEQPLDCNALQTMWRTCFIAEGYENRAAIDAALMRGQRALEQFFTWWKREPRSVVTVETGFKLPVPTERGEPLILSGRFDRIERFAEGLHIIDYKTGEPRSQEDVDNDLQMSIYALAAADQYKLPVTKLTLLFLGEEGLVERTTTRSAAQLKDALTSIKLLGSRIDANDFTPTPGRVCHSCPYRDICPSKV